MRRGCSSVGGGGERAETAGGEGNAKKVQCRRWLKLMDEVSVRWMEIGKEQWSPGDLQTADATLPSDVSIYLPCTFFFLCNKLWRFHFGRSLDIEENCC